MKTVVQFVLLIGWVGALSAAPPTGRYKTIVDRMNALKTQYSSFASMVSIGTNDDGVELYGLRISVTPSAPDPKKVAHLVVGTHHGNELAAPLFTMHFTEEILKRYASQELYRGNLADTEWMILPVLNVSGYNGANRHEHGHDPNRDYPCPCPAGTVEKLKSIRNLMDHMKTRVYSGTLTVHGYVGSLTYPWGVFANISHTLDHNQYEKITAKAAAINGYRHGTHTDVVYPANGTYEDYAYFQHGMW